MSKGRWNRPRPTQLGDLTHDARNANRGTPRGREALGRSLQEYGPGRAVLIDRHGVIIAGNKTVEQAKALNIPLRVVKTDGTHLIAVQRNDLDLTTDARARALALADNRVAEIDLAWDPEVLKELYREGLDLSPFWSDEELATIVGESVAARADENRVVEPGPTDITRGDLFRLGPHQLLCGDATNAADVERLLGDVVPALMATDPPYGISYDPAWRHRAYPNQRTAVGAVSNDDNAAWAAAFQLYRGDVLYTWHASAMAAVVALALETAGFDLRAQIVWVKQHFALGRGDYHYQHEPCWYAVRKGATSHWQGDRTQSTVWTVPNLNAMGGTRSADNAPTGHATQKPVALFEIPIRNHTTAGEGVYDPFAGSGTAIIAAERTGRVAYAMDVDPRYVQVAVSRWEQCTGRRASRVSRRSRRRS
jgi:DNA modification methylase